MAITNARLKGARLLLTSQFHFSPEMTFNYRLFVLFHDGHFASALARFIRSLYGHLKLHTCLFLVSLNTGWAKSFYYNFSYLLNSNRSRAHHEHTRTRSRMIQRFGTARMMNLHLGWEQWHRRRERRRLFVNARRGRRQSVCLELQTSD